MRSRTLLRLISYLRPHRRTVAFAFALLGVYVASQVTAPLLVRVFIDRYLTQRTFPEGPLVLMGAGYLLLSAVGALAAYVEILTFQMVALRVVQQMRIDVFSKVQDLGLSFFDRTPIGSLISRITNDTEAIKDLYMSVLSSFVQNAALMLGIFAALFALDVRLAAIDLVLIPIIAFIMYLYRRLTGPIYHAARHQLSRLNARLSESLQGMYVIQAMVQERRMQREFGEINDTHYRVRMRMVRMNALLLRPLVGVISTLAVMGVLAWFGWLSLTPGHAAEVGAVFVFLSYVQRMFEPVNDMMQRLNIFQQAAVSADRVFELLDTDELAPREEPEAVKAADEAAGAEPAAPGARRGPRIREGRVEFRDVSFSYDGKTDVLRHVSFTAEPGRTVALVGHTGSGKSTIASLLLRFYRVERGEILIDGVPLAAIPEDELRASVGLVLQDPFLFTGDIRRNIRLGNDAIPDEAIREAARFVQADAFIERLPAGYGAPVGERGATFSGGQRQLIAFARTMAIDPRILVLDEATASIDTETEGQIQEALARMRKGRTTIAIAHRLSTIQDADLILVLHRGEIVERGTHAELLAAGGLYHKMYRLQQGAAESEAAV